MSKEYRVNVYENVLHDEVVARVRYNSKLDYWDGRCWSNGGVGRHLGITKLRDGRYVLIYGTEHQDEYDYAEIVSDNIALQAILKSGNFELLKTRKFAPLNKLYQNLNDSELYE